MAKLELSAICTFILMGLAASEEIRLVLSGYSNELDTVDFDTATGELKRVARQTWGDAMTFMDFQGDSLYAIHEVTAYEDIENDGAISRWTLGADGLTWERQEYSKSYGAGPAHVIADTERNMVYAANYGGGTWSAFKTDPATGAIIGDAVQSYVYDHFTAAVPSRQEAPHPHAVALFEDSIYVVDLGGDRVYHYRIDETQEIVYDDYYDLEAGSGPRHMVFDAARSRAYLANELKQSIVIYEVEAGSGHLTFLDEIPIEIDEVTDPLSQTQAEIELSGDGSNLYVSSRGVGTLLNYRVTDSAPYLEETQELKSAGTWPRHFLLSEDGQFLFLTSRWENLLEVYSVAADGTLTFNAAIDTISNPVVIQIV